MPLNHGQPVAPNMPAKHESSEVPPQHGNDSQGTGKGKKDTGMKRPIASPQLAKPKVKPASQPAKKASKASTKDEASKGMHKVLWKPKRL